MDLQEVFAPIFEKQHILAEAYLLDNSMTHKEMVDKIVAGTIQGMLFWAAHHRVRWTGFKMEGKAGENQHAEFTIVPVSPENW